MDILILKKSIETALFEQMISDAGKTIGYPNLKDEQRKAVTIPFYREKMYSCLSLY